MLQGKNRVSYQQDMQLSIWAKFKAVMNNSISSGGAKFLGGINIGHAFFFLEPLPLLAPVSTVLVSHLWQRSKQVGEGTKKEKEWMGLFSLPRTSRSCGFCCTQICNPGRGAS